MPQVSVREEYAQAASLVWALVGRFEGLEDWAPGVDKTVMEGNGPGAHRILSLSQGGSMTERLESFEPDSLTYSYSIIEGPLPVRDYVATLRVHPLPGNRAAVEWSSSFEPADGITDEKAIRIIEKMYRTGLESLRRQLGDAIV